MNWSHSRLDCFRCPRRYQLRYVLEQPEEPMPQLENGSLLHDMIREYAEYCYTHGRLDCDSKAARTVASRAEDGNLQKQFMAFAGRHLWDFDGVLGRVDQLAESWHEAELPDGLGLFRARMDWLTFRDGLLQITDWKSGWVYPTIQPEEAPTQLKRYAWLMLQELGEQVQEVEVRLEYIGSGAGWNWQVDLGDMDVIEEQLCGDVRDILDYGAKHPEGEWRLDPGAYCEGCGYRQECDAYAEEYMELPEYPANCVKAIHLHGAGRKAATDALRKHVETYGPHTDAHGMTWAQHESSPRQEIAEGRELEFVEALLTGKHEPSRYVQGRKLEGLPEAFGQYLVEKPGGRRWGAKRLNGDEQEADDE